VTRSPGVRCVPARIRQVRAGSSLTELCHWFTLVAPLPLACRTRVVWQYRPVPSLSGPLVTLPCASRVRLPPASGVPLRRGAGGVLHPTRLVPLRVARGRLGLSTTFGPTAMIRFGPTHGRVALATQHR